MDKEEKEKLFGNIFEWYNTFVPGKEVSDEDREIITKRFYELTMDELNELIQRIKDEVTPEMKDRLLEESIKASYSIGQTVRAYNEAKALEKLK